MKWFIVLLVGLVMTCVAQAGDPFKVIAKGDPFAVSNTDPFMVVVAPAKVGSCDCTGEPCSACGCNGTCRDCPECGCGVVTWVKDGEYYRAMQGDKCVAVDHPSWSGPSAGDGSGDWRPSRLVNPNRKVVSTAQLWGASGGACGT